MRRLGWRRALAGAAALLVAAASTAPALAAPTDAVEGLYGTVTSDPAPVVGPGQSMTVVATVTNGASAAIDGARVVLRVSREPFDTRAGLVAWLDGSSRPMETVARGQVGTEIEVPGTGGQDPATVSRLAAGASDTVSVTAAARDLPFESGTWGVHGVRVDLVSSAGTTTLLTGAVTWRDAAIPELTLATVVTSSGLGTDVTAALAASDLPGVSFAFDGTVLDTDTLASLDLDGRDVMRLPSMDPDLISLAHAEETTLLDFSLTRSRDSAVTADLPWLAVIPEVDRAAGALAASTGASALLLTDTGNEEELPTVTVARTGKGRLPVLRPDPVMSAAVAASEVTMPGDVGATLGLAALTAAEADGPVLAWSGDEWNPTGTATALSALVGAPFVTTVPVSELAATETDAAAGFGQSADEAADLPRSDILGLANRLSRLEDLSLTAELPAQILNPGGQTLLGPLQRSLRYQDVSRGIRLTQATMAVDETLGALRLAAGSDVNFIADKGSLPVTIQNDLDVDATVVVDMTSFSPNLQIRNAPTVTVPAGSSVSVPIEVEAVSSADVRATTVLRNTDGVAIADPVSMNVRVRADWGTAITAVFTGGLVVLLIMGVIRTIRRGRKDTRTGPRRDPEAAASSPAEEHA